MLIALFPAAILQVGVEPKPCIALTWEAAHPALMAKAPGAPGYGVQFTTTSGKLVLTNLQFNPTTRQPLVEIYRILGNAGSGPYRLGLELGFMPKRPPFGNTHPSWADNYYYIVSSEAGYPAKAAGLEPGKRGVYAPMPGDPGGDPVPGFLAYVQTVIEGVDGSNWGWNLGNLLWHITNSPVVEVNMIKRPIFGGPSRWNVRVTLRKLETPTDPADGAFEIVRQGGWADPALVKPWLDSIPMWKDLLALRSRVPRMAPLPIDLPAGRRWVVVAPLKPGGEHSASGNRGLEVWTEDPLTAPYPFSKAIADIWPEPSEGFAAGRVLRIENQWYQIQSMASDPDTGRLTIFHLLPWEADILPLLGGQTMAKALGTMSTPQPRESLEQLANRALLEWKTRTLPARLATQSHGSAEDLVLRLEQGLLDLDLEVKGIRNRLDAAARATADWKAQAELAAKEGKPIPAALPPPAESERLADLLDQRKAILMAILGSAKQALANLRR